MPRAKNASGNSLPSSPIDYSPEVGERIKSIIESVGGLRPAGELAGVTDETIAKWRDGKVKPSFFGLATIAVAARKSVDWVLFGPGARSDSLVPAPAGFDEGDDVHDFTMVPRYDVSASAGFGLVALAEEVVEHLAFKTAWLRDMGLSPGFVALVTCRGRSQDPLIKDGALMLVDIRPNQTIRSGCFYIIVLDGDVLVKLINRRVDGTIELKSINPEYPTEVIDSQHLDRLTIPGQVVWAGQKL